MTMPAAPSAWRGAALAVESLGRVDLVSAHVGQHLILGDIAAALLVHPPRSRCRQRPREASARAAAGFNLPTEPWLFVFDERGRLATRLDGSFGFDAFEAP